MANCPICLANTDIVGRMHRCIPKAAPIAPEKPAGEFKSGPPSEATYKYRDPDGRRAYMREYMRKRRAK